MILMLNSNDIKFMTDAQAEIRGNRETEVTLLTEEPGGRHPITNEPIDSVPKEYEIIAVVTIITNSTGSGVSSGVNIKLANGIEVVTGDIVVDMLLSDFDDLGISVDDITKVFYDDIPYKILSFGKLGIGEKKRLEITGRREY